MSRRKASRCRAPVGSYRRTSERAHGPVRRAGVLPETFSHTRSAMAWKGVGVGRVRRRHDDRAAFVGGRKVSRDTAVFYAYAGCEISTQTSPNKGLRLTAYSDS
jgi:hypothetical protein